MSLHTKRLTRKFPGLAPCLIAGLALLISACVFNSEADPTPEPAAKAESTKGPPAGELLATLQAEADAMAKAEVRIAENIARTRQLQAQQMAFPAPSATPSPTRLTDAVPGPALSPTPTVVVVPTPTPTPTPTPSPTSIPIRPDQWDLYENERYGYTMRVAPGWVVNQVNPAAVSIKSPDGAATIAVLFLAASNPDITAYSNVMLQTRKDQAKVRFSLGKRANRNAETHGIARMDYMMQTDMDKCLEFATDLLVSNREPEPQLFDVAGTVCEESAGQYWPPLDAMVDSFTLERYKTTGE